MVKDHPIFLESMSFIRSKLSTHNFNFLEVKVLERLIHTSGDFEIQNLLKFSDRACEIAIQAIRNGAPILTDTQMASVAIESMAKQTGNLVFPAKKWIKNNKLLSLTKTAYGIEKGWIELSEKFSGDNSPIVVFGSSPTALENLLDILEKRYNKPSLIVGMPVGFIGVENSKKRLINSRYPYIILRSTRGGAAMAAATINALLRESI